MSAILAELKEIPHMIPLQNRETSTMHKMTFKPAPKPFALLQPMPIEREISTANFRLLVGNQNQEIPLYVPYGNDPYQFAITIYGGMYNISMFQY